MMKTSYITFMLRLFQPLRNATLIILSGMLLWIGMGKCTAPKPPVFESPLLENMGNYHVAITTSSKYAQRFFDQGIILANAFNHGEAARSFEEAIRQDSACAMAYWGLAYVLGPNYNTNNNLGEDEVIIRALQKANLLSNQSHPWEKALIKALQTKFPAGETTDETAYAEAMRSVYHRFPDNDLVVTLFAESLMNLHAWDLYSRKGGHPRPWTPEIVNMLEKALELNSGNPLANHLYLHATEAAPDVEKALPSAERLAYLVPSAGHLIHMPSHIYINTGDYHKASEANEAAVKIDSAYIAECQVQGFYPQLLYPHNWHFLSATATFEGRGARAIEAAFNTAAVVDNSYLEKEGYEATQHYKSVAYNVLVKFAQWEKILSLPPPDLPYPRAIWHFARGMAFANLNRLDRAKEELTEVQQLEKDSTIRNMLIWEINSCSDVVAIAARVLEAECNITEGNFAEAILLYEQAIAIEDALNYTEPPDWFFSVRHLQGDLLLHMKQYAEAEAVYREDLSYWVRNGYALNGLYYSLIGQGKTEEAKIIFDQFETAWSRADTRLKYSRVDPKYRENLDIQVKDLSSPELAYMVAGTCGF